MTKMMQEIKEQPGVIARLEETNRETLVRLTEELKAKNIKQVLFTGRGTSDHACVYAQYLLGAKYGVLTSQALPSCITAYGGSVDTENLLAIGVSQSGCAADALAVLTDAKQRGAVTLAVTNDPESPMAKFANYHLCCGAGPEVSVAATKTFTAQMGALLLLCAYWHDDKCLLADFAALPAKMEETLEKCGKEIGALTAPYKDLRDGFVLSRGLAYPVALETALKTQETCYIRMKAHAVSDFYHGPLALIDPETAVFVYAPRGAVQKDDEAMADRIREIGAEPLVVTDDAELASKSPNSFLLPETGCEFTSPFLYAVFAQCFAESLCGQKGLNPDQPRNLKKVTITK